MDFQYVTGKPEGRHEAKVVANGYKWVRTNAIGPFNSNKDIDFSAPDRILPHSHHSINTHLIVKGDLTVTIESESQRKYTISTAAEAAKELVVKPGVTYRGRSTQGCRFVKGHRSLSPGSAERFIDRGTLRIVSESGGACQLVSERTLKLWLREAKFNPHGKAEPKKGEDYILQYNTDDKKSTWVERRARLELARWFENEWKDENRRWPRKYTRYLVVFVILVAIIWQVFIC
ncbi:hypothetical protein GGR54DRAFT_625671 [Hypoxylon sp. NC1633]|nr:hypothetical protein GGR54DRAFT_625671 [Hypoxylon sp. NC1633]